MAKLFLVCFTGLILALSSQCCQSLETEGDDRLLKELSSFVSLQSSSSTMATSSLHRNRSRRRQQEQEQDDIKPKSSTDLQDDPFTSNNTEIHIAPYPEFECSKFKNMDKFCAATTTTTTNKVTAADGCCHGYNMLVQDVCKVTFQYYPVLVGQICFWCCDGIIISTESPTFTPTTEPSQVPSVAPSLSMSPTTSEPSFLPSSLPSLVPTGKPSISSSPSTSMSPSQSPSISTEPSFVPSIQPSTSPPSVQPSTSPPSDSPTTSLSPTDAPSDAPTKTHPYQKIDYCDSIAKLDGICGSRRIAGCCESEANYGICTEIYAKYPYNIGSICYWCCDYKIVDPAVVQTSEAPSISPTNIPSTSPTKQPTLRPTRRPTARPTASPITPSPVASLPDVSLPDVSPPVTSPPTIQPSQFTGSYICSAGSKKNQFCTTTSDCGGESCIPEPPLNSKYMVGSYYYPWHGPDFHGGQYLREYLIPPQLPELGEYDDRKEDVIGRHLAWTRVVAKSNLWVTSWAGRTERRDKTIRENIMTHPNLPGTKISLFYETLSRIREKVIETPQTYANGTIMTDANGTIITKEDRYVDTTNPYPDMEYMAETYFGDPNYLRIDGKPVVFVYVTRRLYAYKLLEGIITDFRDAARAKGYEDIYIVGDQTWNKAPTAPYEPFKLLNAVTNYDVYGNMGRQPGYAEQSRVDLYYRNQKGWYDEAKKQGCSFIPATSPGYNDRGTRLAANHPGTSRKLSAGSEFGSLFKAMMEQAIKIADPSTGNIIMITSFNEWHEDTQIEPVKVSELPTGNATNPDLIVPASLTYEGYGERYLDIIRNVTTPS